MRETIQNANSKQFHAVSLSGGKDSTAMRQLARNMAWMLHCIEAGKAAGFDHPQHPPRPMTNFIR